MCSVVDSELIKKCKLNQDDIINLGNFKIYNQDRTKFLKLNNELNDDLKDNIKLNDNLNQNKSINKLNDSDLKDYTKSNDNLNKNGKSIIASKSIKKSSNLNNNEKKLGDKLKALKFKIELNRLKEKYNLSSCETSTDEDNFSVHDSSTSLSSIDNNLK